MNDAIKQKQTNKYSATDHCCMAKQKYTYIMKSEVRTWAVNAATQPT
jgi:hypothetical protein